MNTDTVCRIMTHMVAFYPDPRRALTVAGALVAGGASYLEVQFPYSDPSADGPSIQKACSAALLQGFTKTLGFEFVREVAARFDVPVFIMSYGGLVFSGGVENFARQAKEAGAAGLIIPDLTPGHDEGLFAAGRNLGLAVMPVIAPTVTGERLKSIGLEEPEFVYAALRAGVTGDRTDLGEKERRFLEKLQGLGAKIIAGFGIRNREQIETLGSLVHGTVIGSMIVGMIEENAQFEDTVLHNRIKDRISRLVKGSGQKEKTDGK